MAVITITIDTEPSTGEGMSIEELRTFLVGVVSTALPDGHEDAEVDWDIDE